MSLRVGVCATLGDGFFEEARSRLIWASSTTDAYKDLGFEVSLIGNASNTKIPYTKSPEWVTNELVNFYGVGKLKLLPLFNPDKYYTKSQDVYIYNYSFPKLVLPYIDLLHSRDPRALQLALSHQKKVIFEDHDEDVQVESRKLICSIISNDNFKLIVCITKKIKEIYQSMGVPSHKLIVADSGVNIKNLSNSLGSKRIGLNKNITFGYAGGLQPERDIDNLILVASKNLSVNFLFIGGREKLVKELQEKAQESGATNIEFLGYLKFSDMRKVLINRCDGMLYTRAKGKHEENSSPLKLFDYFNYEKPIVCANTSTTKEYINYQGIFGYVPSSISSLNDAIHECIVCIQNGGRVDSELIDFAKEKSWVARQKNILDKAGLL